MTQNDLISHEKSANIMVKGLPAITNLISLTKGMGIKKP